MQFSLLKFNQKRDCRLWLKNFSDLQLKYSSIYLLNDSFYLVVASESILPTIQSTAISVFSFDTPSDYNGLDLAEQELALWGQSELMQSLSLVQFETRSTLSSNGRKLVSGNTSIIRTFDQLADIFVILNYTPDSFSDGGKYNQIETCCARIIDQVSLGATIVDIGVESTRPNATTLTAGAEIAQLQLLLPEVINLKRQYGFLISIDTYHSETAKWLAELDIEILNDVSGSLPLDIVKQFTNAGKYYVAMHSLTVPAQKNIVLDLALDPVEHIYQWATTKLATMDDFGIQLAQVILDPGIGFGNNSAQAWYILNKLSKFLSLPCETLLGHSRKSLFSHLSDKKAESRDLDTAVVASLVMDQVAYLRVHDVENLRQVYPVVKQLHYATSRTRNSAS
jgi:dihydropteroate synthase